MERDAQPMIAAACPSCGRPVDPLRAGHVAILDGGFRYFCDETCKRSFVRESTRPLPSEVETAEPPRVAPAPERAVVAEPRVDARAEPHPVDVAPVSTPSPVPTVAAGSPVPTPPERARPEAPPGPLSASALALVGAAGVLAGLLAPSLALLGPSGQSARFVFATLALLACCARALAVPRDPSDVHPLVSFAPVIVLWGVALYARSGGDARALHFASVSGLAAAAYLLSSILVDRAREGVRSARSWIRHRLNVSVRVVHGDQTVVVPAEDVKPGEEVVALAGDTLGVDAAITAGDAVVTPWIDAVIEVAKREGSPVVAGARVVSGSFRAVTTWSGPDRAWLKLAVSPHLRPDVVGPIARRVRVTVERGAVVAAGLATAFGVANGLTGVDLLAMAAVAAFSVAGGGAVGIVALHQARGPILGLAHGVAYRDAAAFDAAGQADVAVLCSRSTLLMGAPEIVALESLSLLGVDHILAIAAGASAVSTHPANVALRDAARAKGQVVEAVRHATYHPGLGVTALTGAGERLVVGSRALLLREKVSIAVADGRVSELEAGGRSVTLVAVGSKLVGLVALQDGLRPGARAAVQRLLDAGIEPVLLSGEARDTCETIGRALDVEHIRPEVLPQDRGSEVRALAEGGHVVAVLGRPAEDDSALGAAQVSIALGAAGATPGEWAVALASDDVRDGARALSIAKEARDRTKVAIVLGLAPGVVATAGITLGLLPLALGPLLSFAGLAAAVVHARR